MPKIHEQSQVLNLLRLARTELDQRGYITSDTAAKLRKLGVIVPELEAQWSRQ